MTSNDIRWIADVNGVKAIATAGTFDFWTRTQGWIETTPPTGLEFQWVRNEQHGGRGVMNHEAAVLHAGLGWVPSDPPPVPGLPEPAPIPAVAPVKSVPPPAANSEGVTANG